MGACLLPLSFLSLSSDGSVDLNLPFRFFDHKSLSLVPFETCLSVDHSLRQIQICLQNKYMF